MPVKISRKGKGKCYTVRTPGSVKAKCTTKGKAERQKRLLNAVEHGFVPTRNKLRKRVMGENS
jgi:hypothetical protein